VTLQFSEFLVRVVILHSDLPVEMYVTKENPRLHSTFSNLLKTKKNQITPGIRIARIMLHSLLGEWVKVMNVPSDEVSASKPGNRDHNPLVNSDSDLNECGNCRLTA